MITIRTSVASALIAITACAAAQDTGKTPAGAERAGNASGSIPAWPGNEVQQTGWSYGKLRSDKILVCIFSKENPKYNKVTTQCRQFSIEASSVNGMLNVE